MKKSTFLIVGKHAVLEALKNPLRKIERVLSFVDEAKIRSIIYVMGLQSNETNSIMAAATIRLKIQVKNVCQSDSQIFQKKSK